MEFITLFGTPKKKEPTVYEKIKAAVNKTRENFTEQIQDLIEGEKEINPDMLEQLEAIMLGADIGVATTNDILKSIKDRMSRKTLQDPKELRGAIKEELRKILNVNYTPPKEIPEGNPFVILMVGVNGGGKIILQASREVEAVLGRDVLEALQQLGIATPADFDAAEQIGLRARHLEQALRLEGGLAAEDIAVRLEADAGAAAVVDLAEVFELALGMAALETHPVKFLAACDLDFEPRGQRVDHGYADAVQTARCLINLGVEFAAGMQRAHDDFER